MQNRTYGKTAIVLHFQLINGDLRFANILFSFDVFFKCRSFHRNDDKKLLPNLNAYNGNNKDERITQWQALKKTSASEGGRGKPKDG